MALRMSIKSHNNPDIFDMCEEQRPYLKISLERDRSPQNVSVVNIVQNIFCVPQKKESHRFQTTQGRFNYFKFGVKSLI